MSRWPETFLAFFVTGRKRPPISLSEIRVLWALDGYRFFGQVAVERDLA